MKRAPVPVLMYHSIGPVPPCSQRRSIFVSGRAFDRQMRLLTLMGYRGVTISEALRHLASSRLAPGTQKVCAITFDDGFQDNIDTALPILRKHGHRATCYVVSDRLGAWNEWSYDVLGARSALADAHGVRQWIEGGMELGAHTRTHARLTHLDDPALKDEVRGSKHALEDRFGVAVTQFCYPWGAHDERVVDAVGEAGFEGATTTQRGRARPGGHPLRIPRVHVLNQHWLPQIGLKIATRYGDRP